MSELIKTIPLPEWQQRAAEFLANQLIERQKRKVHTEAVRLARVLLKLPQQMVSHQYDTTLPDGRTLHVELVNTRKVRSVHALYHSKQRANQLVIMVHHETGDQRGYLLQLNVGTNPELHKYRESQDGFEIRHVAECTPAVIQHLASVRTHYANFDLLMQHDVYQHAEQLLRVAHATVCQKEIPPLAP